MRAGGRLALYGAGLAASFAAAFVVAGAVVPAGFVAAWAGGSDMNTHGEGHGGTDQQEAAGPVPNGVSLNADGFTLSPVQAPASVGTAGELNFRIVGEDGDPVTEFTEEHEKELHLIVVRSDGARFRHVHPVLDENSGIWSLPWTWDEAGSYRVYADFTPTAANVGGLTLTRTVEVDGDVTPVQLAEKTVDEVDGYTVRLAGALGAGSADELTLTVERDGDPVTNLDPYLGAFGHLVALREGDLAYVHVHPEGDEPEPGAEGGPDIRFAAEAPTAGRYLLYLDFQVEGKVRTASFVVDAAR